MSVLAGALVIVAVKMVLPTQNDDTVVVGFAGYFITTVSVLAGGLVIVDEVIDVPDQN